MPVTIRPARAEDAPILAGMINEFAAQNLMLPRTEEAILQSLADWLVAEEVMGANGAAPQAGGRILGCGALAALTDELVEIRSLAVHPDGQGQGIGSQLVEALLEQARQRGFRQVCALTLREHFFERLGFHVVDRWSISPKLWQECIYCAKFHRCDEVAVLKAVGSEPPQEADLVRPAAWNPLLKWPAWQPLKLAYHRRPTERKG
ncbi:MAG: GNAT family N-acetyltransferase [Caldilineae bacterium]|nr:MAG: GNAT family N-acetyltransferase [Caldilineae bacterium]